jgi:hypothetical protein
MPPKRRKVSSDGAADHAGQIPTDDISNGNALNAPQPGPVALGAPAENEMEVTQESELNKVNEMDVDVQELSHQHEETVEETVEEASE